MVTRVTGFGQALTLLLIVQTKHLLLALLISLAGLAGHLLVPDQIDCPPPSNRLPRAVAPAGALRPLLVGIVAPSR